MKITSKWAILSSRDGPRLHVRSTGEIENFSLHKELVYDARYGAYCLIGLMDADPDSHHSVNNRNAHFFLNKKSR